MQWRLHFDCRETPTAHNEQSIPLPRCSYRLDLQTRLMRLGLEIALQQMKRYDNDPTVPLASQLSPQSFTSTIPFPFPLFCVCVSLLIEMDVFFFSVQPVRSVVKAHRSFKDHSKETSITPSQEQGILQLLAEDLDCFELDF